MAAPPMTHVYVLDDEEPEIRALRYVPLQLEYYPNKLASQGKADYMREALVAWEYATINMNHWAGIGVTNVHYVRWPPAPAPALSLLVSTPQAVVSYCLLPTICCALLYACEAPRMLLWAFPW